MDKIHNHHQKKLQISRKYNYGRPYSINRFCSYKHSNLQQCSANLVSTEAALKPGQWPLEAYACGKPETNNKVWNCSELRPNKSTEGIKL